MTKLKIIGIRETIYVADRLGGRDSKGQFVPYKALAKSHTIFARVLEHSKEYRVGDLVAMVLNVDEDECSSGYCVSQTARLTVSTVSHWGPLTHVPTHQLIISFPLPLTQRPYEVLRKPIKNELFTYWERGDDWLYPTGKYAINFSLLKKTCRYKENRVVYILTGSSGIGKSFLAGHFTGMEVYETDVKQTLPKKIYANVIVLGNRSGFSVEDVKARIFGKAEVVICSFTESSIVNDAPESNIEPQWNYADSLRWEAWDDYSECNDYEEASCNL